LDLVPLQLGSTAAAARLRISRIEDLPALKLDPLRTGNRHLGIYTERTASYRGFWQTFGPTRQISTVQPLPTSAADFRPIGERLRYLRDALDSCERFTRYLRFTGQNLHAMGCFQYNDDNTPYAPPDSLFDSRVPRDLREMAVRVFGQNGIDVLAVVEYNGHSCLRWEHPYNDGQVAAGQDCAVIVSDEGRQPPARESGRGYGAGWNPLHPRVETLMLDVAQDVTRKFERHKNFRGVNWTVYLTGEWGPGFGGMRWSPPLRGRHRDRRTGRR
jgi:hypothetical protein